MNVKQLNGFLPHKTNLDEKLLEFSSTGPLEVSFGSGVGNESTSRGKDATRRQESATVMNMFCIFKIKMLQEVRPYNLNRVDLYLNIIISPSNKRKNEINQSNWFNFTIFILFV